LLYLAASVLGNDYIATDERMADHSGGKVWGVIYLRPLEHWNRGFESRSRYGCLCVRLFCVCIVLCR
jgi:hypothetical protein